MTPPREPGAHPSDRRTWFSLLPTRSRPRWLRTLLGLACGLTAIAMRLPLEPYLDGRLPFVFFLPAVTVAAAKGGIAASLAAVGITTAYLVLGSPLLDHFDLANGLPLTLYFVSSALVTAVAQELRLALARSDRLREQQATMLHELNHRVKNTLATVQALARQSVKGEGGPEQFEARLIALAKTHDLLTRDDWSSAPLYAVLEGELSPYRAGADHIVLIGPEVSLPPGHVLALGMTIHELTTNAAKYGALSIPGGRVEVAWRTEPCDAGGMRLHLTWRESGGPIVSAPTRTGFGLRLIGAAMRRELAGTVDLTFDPAGLCCRIDVPLGTTPAGMLMPTR